MNPSPSLFYVPCPTCEARLRFSNEKLLGQIVPCPKCGSMVLIQPLAKDEKRNPVPEESQTPQIQPSLLETVEEKLVPEEQIPPIPSAPPVVKQEIQPPEPPSIQPSAPTDDEEDLPIVSSHFSLDHPLSVPAMLGWILLLGGTIFVILTAILLTLRGCSPDTPSPSEPWEISDQVYSPSSEEMDSETSQDSPEEETDLPSAEDSEVDLPEANRLSSTEASPSEEDEKDLSEELMQSDLGRQLLGEREIPPTENSSSENMEKNREKAPASSEKKRITVVSSDAEDELELQEPEKMVDARHEDRLEFQRKSRSSLFADDPPPKKPESDETLQEALENLPDLPQKEEDVFAEEGTSHIVTPSAQSKKKGPPLTILSNTARKEYLPESMAQKLDIPLKTFQMEGKPITSVLKMATQISGVPISADWKDLKGLGAEPNQTVSIRMQNTTVREVLERTLEECSLGCMPNRQSLRIVGLEVTEILRAASKEETQLERYTLNLEDLATVHALQSHNAQSGLQEMLRWIRIFVHPATWDEHGGPGKIMPSRNASKVNLSHYPFIMDEVQRFCNQLRFARKMPVQEWSPVSVLPARQDGTQMGETTATPRWTQSEKARKQLIACDFSDGISLREGLRKIAQIAKIQLILDEPAIEKISVTDLVMDAEIPGYDGKKPDLPSNLLELKVAKSFENLSLEEVLTDVIRPFPLFCYPISADAFFLTTSQAATRKTMVEFYPIGDLLSKKEAAGIFLDSIRQKIAPQTWKNTGGMGEIVYDAPSRTLIVLQSPPVLRQVEYFLEQYRKRSQTARGAKP